MKNRLILFIILFSAGHLSGQELSSKVFANAGLVAQNGNLVLSYTIGETFVHTSPLNNPNSIVFGFQQTENIVIKTVEIDGKQFEVNTFPNPVKDNLVVAIKGADRHLTFSLFDMTGRKLNTFKVERFQQQVIVPMQELPAGVYLLSLQEGVFQQKVIKQ